MEMTQRLGMLLAVLFVLCSSTTAKAQSESTHTPLQAQEGAQQQSVQPQAAPSQIQTPPKLTLPKLTLDDAIRTAKAQHPLLRQARQAIVAAEARTKQANSAYFPQITASGIAKQGLSGASGALGLRGLITSPLFRDIGA